jgi:hypothetical protein
LRFTNAVIGSIFKTNFIMKKLIFLGLFASIFVVNAHAQSGLGVKGGVTFNQVYTDAGSLKANFNESLDTRTGYVFGVYGRLGKKLFLQPEVVVANKGGSIDVIKVGSNIPQTLNFKYTNIDVPVLVGYKLFNRIRLMAGPVATLNINEDQKLKDALQGYVQNGVERTFNQASFGYQLGVGIKLLGVEVDLRKEGSLGDISMLNVSNNSQFTQRASGWQLTLGIKII